MMWSIVGEHARLHLSTLNQLLSDLAECHTAMEVRRHRKTFSEDIEHLFVRMPESEPWDPSRWLMLMVAASVWTMALATTVVKLGALRLRDWRRRDRGASDTPVGQPPALPQFLLALFLPRKNWRAELGDLVEQYEEHVLPMFGRRKANIWFYKQCLAAMWPVTVSRLIRLVTLAWLYDLWARIGSR